MCKSGTPWNAPRYGDESIQRTVHLHFKHTGLIIILWRTLPVFNIDSGQFEGYQIHKEGGGDIGRGRNSREIGCMHSLQYNLIGSIGAAPIFNERWAQFMHVSLYLATHPCLHTYPHPAVSSACFFHDLLHCKQRQVLKMTTSEWYNEKCRHLAVWLLRKSRKWGVSGQSTSCWSFAISFNDLTLFIWLIWTCCFTGPMPNGLNFQCA